MFRRGGITVTGVTPLGGDAAEVLGGAPVSVISDALDRMGRRHQVLDTFARAAVVGIDVEARAGGVDVRPGDLVVGDIDGIVVVPQELVADVAEAVVTKHRLEGNAREDLLSGMSIREVWKKYGVL